MLTFAAMGEESVVHVRDADSTISPSVEATLPMAGGAGGAAGQLGRYEVRRVIGSGSMGIVLLAYDPDLDRDVALKLLHPAAAERDDPAERLARAARAMARLNHPNVATVYEVGRANGRIFLAMELVSGPTLRQWLARRPRSWRAIAAMFVNAGRGLAAAHATGMVHRDFKPDNVLVGRDGRPRVCDFGLVGSVSAVGLSLADDSSPRRWLATRGTAGGTPAYMSPEAWEHTGVSPRSDQFSFCVSLWEALYGHRPFGGQGLAEVRRAILTGTIARPAHRAGIPRWLEAALRRGLARDPAQRWPALTGLLDWIDQRARRPRWTSVHAAAGVAVVVSAIATAVGLAGGTRDACPPPESRLAQVWNPSRDAILRGHLAAIDPALGATRAAVASAAFARDHAAWRTMYVATCRATRVEGWQSDALLDRRMRCLDRALLQLDATIGVVGQSATVADVDRAVHAVIELPSLAPCADRDALAHALDPPADPVRRLDLAGFEIELADLAVRARAGRFDEVTARLVPLVQRARRIGFPPALASALDQQAIARFKIGDHAGAIAVLDELALVAAEAHDDTLAARTWLRGIRSRAELGRLDDAEHLVPIAAASAARAGSDPDLRFDLLQARAELATAHNDYDAARALFAEGLRVDAASASSAPRAIERRGSALRGLLNVDLLEGKWHDAADRAQRGFDLYVAALGPDHPEAASLLIGLGEALRQLGKPDQALAAYREAARIDEARLPASPVVALTLDRVGGSYAVLERPAEGIPYLERAIAMARATMPADDLRLAQILADYVASLIPAERYDEARHASDEQLAIYGRHGPSVNLAISLTNRGELEVVSGHCAEAAPPLTRALAMFEALPTTRAYVIAPLVQLARCARRERRWGAALATLARIRALPAAPAMAASVLEATCEHGQLLVESGRDVVGGMAELRAARAALRGDHPLAKRLDTWMAAYAGTN